MTISLKAFSFLCLISSVIYQIRTETPVTVGNHAEEEKKLNIVSDNITFRTTPTPNEDESATTLMNDGVEDEGSLIEDESQGEGVLSLLKPETNLTEYDELSEESKNDASPENSVERESPKFVNEFFSSRVEFTTPVHKENVSTTLDSLIPVNTTTPFPVETIELTTLTSPNISCSEDDDKCKNYALLSKQYSSSPMSDSKISAPISSASLSVATLPSWNYLKPVKPLEQNLQASSTETTPFEMLAPTESSSTADDNSTTAPTSENLIPVESSRVSKSEGSFDASTNKSEKAKQGKYSTSSPDRSITTFLKAITTTSATVITKLGVPEETPEVSTLLTKIIDTVTRAPDFSDTFRFFNTTSPLTPIFYSSKFTTPREMLEVTTPSMFRSKTTKTPEITVTSSWYIDDIPERKSETVTPHLTSSLHEFSHFVTKSTEMASSSIVPDVSYYFTSAIPTTVQPYFSTQFIAKDLPPIISTTEENIPPPRLSYPGCSSLPKCIEMTLLDTSWDEFCPQIREFQKFISKAVSHYTRPIHPHQIILDAENCVPGSSLFHVQVSPDVTVSFYITDDSGEYEERFTEICSVILRKWAPTTFRNSVLEVRLYDSELQSTALPDLPELNSGFVAAVSISAVAGVALCMLCILLVVMKQKLLQSRNSESTSPTADAYSLDSLSINASFRRRKNRKSARSYLNHAFSDQEVPSHPLNVKTLQNCLKNKDLLEEEFRRLPMNMPKLDQIPEGAHVKNRYSNILPRPESRVVLAEPSGDPLKCYINANYVKGYGGKAATYIACQAPLPEGIEDFWRMVWEQQCRVIIMLTMFEENGTSRCAMYFPQSTLVSHPPHGDFQVSLVKKDVYEYFTMSTIRLLDLEKNLFRDIVHLWYTCWPEVGVPKDPTSLITFVQHCRSFINCNTGPTVVHCSTGTGRTGVFLTLDLCMREYDESKSIDILQTVSQIRRERAGAVQNKDQYILIHEAMLEFICRMSNQSLRPSLQNGN